MNEVSLFRLYLLRAVYLVIAAGLGIVIWPGIIHHDNPWGHMQGVVNCMLAAVGLLAAIGIRYPLQMLPVLFFEMIWKSIWLLAVALPAWRTGQMDAAIAGTVSDCVWAIMIPLAMPWAYVFRHYVKVPGDRWRGLAH